MTQFHDGRFDSWGRVKRQTYPIAMPTFRDQLASCLNDLANPSVLAVGLGRSYGDSGLNSGGGLIDVSRVGRFIAFNAETGLLRAEAGLSLSALLAATVPRGWFLPTTPGTRFVSLAGAIANDVHGKNHHRAGALGCHVRKIGLLRSDKGRVELTPDGGDPLFAATIGGLGLTGIITDIELQLARTESAYLDVERVPFAHVREFSKLAADSAVSHEHTVAWIDCASTGHQLGRGIFQRANWCRDGDLAAHDDRTGLTVPFEAPGFTLNRLSVRAFNALYYHAQKAGAAQMRQHYAAFFYPLDKIRHWNRLYGRLGFYQYQCVIPPAEADPAVEAMIRTISKSGAGSFLAVLKSFGNRASPGMLSFPHEGLTLALDFANRGDRTIALLSSLDAIVREARGRLYPAKDGRVPADMFRMGYPAWETFAGFKDPRISSDFWRRVAS